MRLITAKTNAYLKVIESGKYTSGETVTEDQLTAVEQAVLDAQSAKGTFETMQDAVEKATAVLDSGLDYEKLTNKPKLNGVEISGNKSFADYGIAEMSAASIASLFD